MSANTFIAGVVPSELGFDGAVTVVKEEVSDGIGCVTVDVPYLNVYGKPVMGQARVYVHEKHYAPGKGLPLTCYTHYEADALGVKNSCDAGWVVVTPHYAVPGESGYPLEFMPAANSYNLARAIIQWARRLPFVDGVHLHMVGGSAGGFMSLSMSAEFFPVTSTFAGQPLFNLAYNVNYIASNTPVAAPEGVPCDQSPMPVLCLVTPLPQQAFAVFGSDMSDEKWYYLSPLAALDRITCPTVIPVATGDVLTPHEQMTSKYVTPRDDSLFPPDYARDFERLTFCAKARKTFEEAVPADSLFIHVEPLPEGALEITPEQGINQIQPPTPPKPISLPWSREKQWNLLVLEEGPPLPHSSHWRYHWAAFPADFQGAYKDQAPPPELLNAAKLQRLLERYEGKQDPRVTLVDGTPVHRTNFPRPERLDVVKGLLDFARLGAQHEARLKKLYAANEIKALGNEVSVSSLARMYDDLKAPDSELDRAPRH